MTRQDTGSGRVTGGCQCGAVRYALLVPAGGRDASLCHCRMCQKAGGGPFMAFLGAPAAALAWTRGTPATFASSVATRRGFCARCGTPLFFQRRPERISVTLGSLDDPGAVAPSSRLGAESVLPWSEHVGALPVRTTASWLADSHRDAIASVQHPDRDT